MRRLLVHCVVGSYIILTLCALSHTLFRRSILPLPVVFFFYGMMAPYQGYEPENSELHAEGVLPDGSMESIDLRRYIPGGRGEYTYRGYLLMLRKRSPEILRERYASLAAQLLEHERAAGKPFLSVRLSWREWPVSTEGYYALDHSPFVSHEFITQSP